MQKVVLNNGVEMPLLGFGVFQIVEAAACEQSVVDAIGAGYRLIDTAASYLNEAAVGRGIQRSGIGRGELFVTTKLWIQRNGYDGTMAAFERSMKRLRDIVVLSKSVRKVRMIENFNVLDYELSGEDIAAIATLDTGTSSFFDHRDPEKVKWLGTRALDV